VTSSLGKIDLRDNCAAIFSSPKDKVYANASSKVYSGGDGSSQESAVVLNVAKNRDGVLIFGLLNL